MLNLTVSSGIDRLKSVNEDRTLSISCKELTSNDERASVNSVNGIS